MRLGRRQPNKIMADRRQAARDLDATGDPSAMHVARLLRSKSPTLGPRAKTKEHAEYRGDTMEMHYHEIGATMSMLDPKSLAMRELKKLDKRVKQEYDKAWRDQRKLPTRKQAHAASQRRSYDRNHPKAWYQNTLDALHADHVKKGIIRIRPPNHDLLGLAQFTSDGGIKPNRPRRPRWSDNRDFT